MKLEWPTDRIDYVPITGRPPLPLPDGAKVVVWPCVNVENWVIDQPMPRTVVNPPGGVAKNVPDIPNWAWHEYGNRVAFWRLKKIFDEFGVAALAGTSFGDHGEGYLRLSYANSEENLLKALDRIEAAARASLVAL